MPMRSTPSTLPSISSSQPSTTKLGVIGSMVSVRKRTVAVLGLGLSGLDLTVRSGMMSSKTTFLTLEA